MGHSGGRTRPSYLLYFVLWSEAKAGMEHNREQQLNRMQPGSKLGLATQDQCSLEALLHKVAGVSE